MRERGKNRERDRDIGSKRTRKTYDRRKLLHLGIFGPYCGVERLKVGERSEVNEAEKSQFY